MWRRSFQAEGTPSENAVSQEHAHVFEKVYEASVGLSSVTAEGLVGVCVCRR